MTRNGRRSVVGNLLQRRYQLKESYSDEEVGFGAVMERPDGSLIDLFCRWDIETTLGKEMADLAFS